MWIALLLACTGSDPEVSKTAEPAEEAAGEELAPAWSAEACRTSDLRDKLVKGREMSRSGWVLHELDVDGDGEDDELRVKSDSGSGMATDDLHLTLASGEEVELEVVFSFARIAQEVPYPEGTSPQVRQVIADALWGTTCEVADPSLVVLRGGEVRWHAGPPVMPPFYAHPTVKGWVLYAGHTHAGLSSEVEFPVELGERDGVTLARTAHGVVATREGAHAWLYVDPGQAKLRWPSELSAKFVGPSEVEITRAPSPHAPESEPVTVRRSW